MSDQSHYMRCMEVWGGNQAVDSAVAMAGLDVWAYSKPYRGDRAGGDVHYVSSCASGRIVRLLIADVSGHGAQVAELASRLRHLMRRYVNHLDQRRLFAHLNSQFAEFSEESRFATAVVFTFFNPTNTLTISNAGHPPPLVYRGKTGIWEVLGQKHEPESRSAPHSGPTDQPANVPLGVLDAPHFDALSLRLNVGDLVLCYTDSLYEARSRDGRQLGTQGLVELANRVSVDEPSAFISTMLESIAEQSPDNLNGDDVTALLFRPNGVSMHYTLGERLSTYRRVFAAAGRAITFRERFPWPDMHMANLGGAFRQKLNDRWQPNRS